MHENTFWICYLIIYSCISISTVTANISSSCFFSFFFFVVVFLLLFFLLLFFVCFFLSLSFLLLAKLYQRNFLFSNRTFHHNRSGFANSVEPDRTVVTSCIIRTNTVCIWIFFLIFILFSHQPVTYLLSILLLRTRFKT